MVKPENQAAEYDPRGLIFESYRMEAVSVEECRSIFFDWAMGANEGAGTVPHIRELLGFYSDEFPRHPMTKVLQEGLATTGKPKRRGGWKARRS